MTSTLIFDDREAYERFKESHPHDATIGAITRLSEEVFVRRFAPRLDGGRREARQIYRNAVNIREAAALVWINIHEALAPHLGQTLFKQIPAEFLDYRAQIPGFDQIFGSLDYSSGEHARSIFGPAAYYADLRRFVEAAIEEASKLRAVDGTILGSTIPEPCLLDYRRPDLRALRLDQTNAEQLLPAIELVNEILEGFLSGSEHGADPYERLAALSFPLELPFHRPLEEIHAYLRKLGTSLHAVYTVFGTAFDQTIAEGPGGDPQLSATYLGMSPAELAILTTPRETSATVVELYGGAPLRGRDGLEHVEVFLDRTGLSRQQLNELLYQDFDRYEVSAGLTRQLFFNRVEDGRGRLEIVEADPNDPASFDRLVHLSPAKLDRIARFLKLARRLGWSYADLDWALRSLQPEQVPERVLHFDGVNDYVEVVERKPLALTSFTIEAWVRPAAAGRAIILARGDRASSKLHFTLRVTGDGRLGLFIATTADDGTVANGVENDGKELVSAAPVEPGVFTHVAASFDGTTLKLYLNGRLDTEEAGPPQAASAGGALSIGRSLFQGSRQTASAGVEAPLQGLGDEPFGGEIAEVRLWSLALADETIAERRFQRASGREINMAGYWPLEETLGQRLPDLSPAGNDGIPGGPQAITRPRWVSRDLALDPPARRGEGVGLAFDGASQLLGADDVDYGAPPALTVELWLRVAPGHGGTILAKGDELVASPLPLLQVRVLPESGKVEVSGAAAAGTFTSAGSVATDRLMHVAFVLEANGCTFYLDGAPEQQIGVTGDSVTARALSRSQLFVGRDLVGDYFQGELSELRIWAVARSAAQIADLLCRRAPPDEPGLVGLWLFGEVEGGMVRDRAETGAHLWPGGVPTHYRPTWDATMRPLPQTVAVPGVALELDGDNDLLVIRNPLNRGLGAYERMTLEVWLKPAPKGLESRRQIILAQGDREAGLCLYLHKGRANVITWRNSLEGNDFTYALLQSEQVKAGAWHHLRVVNDEFPVPPGSPLPLHTIELSATLDGVALKAANGAMVLPSFRLSPVGPAYLGGLVRGIYSAFGPGEEADQSGKTPYFYAGQLTDLRLWGAVVGEGSDPRCAPSVGGDLVLHMPTDEGEGWIVHDRAGKAQTPENEHRATLDLRDIGFETETKDAALAHIYTHYGKVGALDWRNYRFAGRLRLVNADDPIGVTVLSRRTAGVDQLYRIGRDTTQRDFRLTAFPAGVQQIASAVADRDGLVSGVEPQANVWYNFLVEVEDTGAHTAVRAKFWADGAAEPGAFQIDAADTSAIRITAGTVGLWSTGAAMGKRQFDDLKVWPRDLEYPKAEELLLDLNFEAPGQVPEPDQWLDTFDRFTAPGATPRFQRRPADGAALIVGATAGPVHTHYTAVVSAPATWANYSFEGRMRLGDAQGAIGVSVLSRYPTVEQCYSLRSDPASGRFALVAEPLGVQPLRSADPTLSLGIPDLMVEAGVWYRFSLAASDAVGVTTVQAKVWREGTAEPEQPQVVAIDDSAVRLTAGTVGLWASGPGEKAYDNLRVLHNVLMDETFDRYAEGQHPTGWRDTGKDNSPDTVESAFVVRFVDGNPALSIRFPKGDGNVHTHFQPQDTDVLAWRDYLFSGRMRASVGDNELAKDVGLGVTFLSRYPEGRGRNEAHNNYYRLRRTPKVPAFHLAHHPDGVREDDRPPTLPRGVADFAVNTWFRFLVKVDAKAAETRVRAKVWREGEPEPSGFQLDWIDKTRSGKPAPISAGAVGLWAAYEGTRYYDSLRVANVTLLSEDSVAADWVESAVQERHLRADDLFRTVDMQDNRLRWVTITDYPLLLRPLALGAARLDGRLQYLAAPWGAGAPLTALSIAAWVRPEGSGVQPIVSLKGTGGPVILALETQGSKTDLRLLAPGADDTLRSSVALPGDGGLVYVGAVLDGDKATLIVGDKAAQVRLIGALQLAPTVIEVGQAGSQRFAGLIGDLRIWGVARDTAALTAQAGRYQRPAADEPGLLAAWAFEDGLTNAQALRAVAAPGPSLRHGGLEGAREPTLVDRLRVADRFWSPERQVLVLDGAGGPVRFAEPAPDVGAAPAPRLRRTVEVWFRLDDATVSRRKQTIYHEGDGDRGLLIYAHDGTLYLGGYNRPSDESGWAGSWMAVGGIESGRWHHAALVLDGRAEVRPEALVAYLDGKPVASAAGSQLYAHRDLIALGALHGRAPLHDGEARDEIGHRFAGRVLEVRGWNATRTAAQIAERWATPLDAAPPELALWWRFDTVADGLVPSGASLARPGTLPAGALRESLALTLPLGPTAQPPARIDAATIVNLAQIGYLAEQHGLKVERVVALWGPLKHSGRDDGTTLFDEAFNPVGVAGERWDAYPDRPIRWDTSGAEARDRDRAIRSRLLGALRVADEDLLAAVACLSGEGETVVELDGPYLARLYRLTQTARALGMKVREYLRLLDFAGSAPADGPTALIALDTLVAWLNGSALTVAELDFFARDPRGPDAMSLFTTDGLRTLAQGIVEQAADFIVTAEALSAPELPNDLGQGQAVDLLAFLRERSLVSAAGAVTESYDPRADFADALVRLATNHGWAGAFVGLQAELDNLFKAQTSGPKVSTLIDRLRGAGLLSAAGLVAQRDSYATEVGKLYTGVTIPRDTPRLLTRVAETLERRAAIQAQVVQAIHATLGARRARLSEAISRGLAAMFDSTDLVADVVRAYLRANGGLSQVTLYERLAELHQHKLAPAQDLAVEIASAAKLFALVRIFKLGASELEALLTAPASFGLSEPLRLRLDELERLARFTQLREALGDSTGALAALLARTSGGSDELLRDTAALAGWDATQLVGLLDHFQTSRFQSAAGLARLKRCFDLAAALGVDARFLAELADRGDVSYAAYSRRAANLLQVLRAGYTAETWERAFREVSDDLAVRRRDALLARALRLLPDAIRRRADADLFYEYFLIDVRVGSAVETSRLVQATAALQLYVQRCLMSLEPGVDPTRIPLVEWEWVKNYRVWEANRKVFLYPENYIEPELRDTKTPFFKDLEQDLMQGDLNAATVEDAFMRYLEKFREVARLKIVGSYLHRELPDERPGATGRRETLYLIGRSGEQQPVFYVRERQRDGLDALATWTPWRKIDLMMNTEFVTPVYSFGRLYLFWSESLKRRASEEKRLSASLRSLYSVDTINLAMHQPGVYYAANQGSVVAAITNLLAKELTPSQLESYRLQKIKADAEGYLVNVQAGIRLINEFDLWDVAVKYSYATLTGAWAPPQTYVEATGQREDPALKPGWQRVYAQRKLDFKQGAPALPGGGVEVEKGTRFLKVDAQGPVALAVEDLTAREQTWAIWVSLAEAGEQKALKEEELTSEVMLFGDAGRAVQLVARTVVAAITGAAEAAKAASEASDAAARAARSAAALEGVGQLRLRMDVVNGAISAAERARDAVRDAATRATIAAEVAKVVKARDDVATAIGSAFLRAPLIVAGVVEIVDAAFKAGAPESPDAAERTTIAQAQTAVGNAAGVAQLEAPVRSAVDVAIRVVSLVPAEAVERPGLLSQVSDLTKSLEDMVSIISAQPAAAKRVADLAAAAAKKAADYEAAQSKYEVTGVQLCGQFRVHGPIEEALKAVERARARKLLFRFRFVDVVPRFGDSVQAVEEARRALNGRRSDDLNRIEANLRAARTSVDFAAYERALDELSALLRTFTDSYTLSTEKLTAGRYHLALIFVQRDDGTVDARLLCSPAEKAEAQPITASVSEMIWPEEDLTLQAGAQIVGSRLAVQLSQGEVWQLALADELVLSNRDRRKSAEEPWLLALLPLNGEETAGTPTWVAAPSGFSYRIVRLPAHMVMPRERILMLYGENVKTLRDTLDAEGFEVALLQTSTARSVDLDIELDKLKLVQTQGLSFNDFATAKSSTLARKIPATTNTLGASDPAVLLAGLQLEEVSLLDVGNQPGWYILEMGDDRFLIALEDKGLQTAEERLTFKTAKRSQAGRPLKVEAFFNDDAALAVEQRKAPLRYRVERLGTYAVNGLVKRLFAGGVEGLLGLPVSGDGDPAPQLTEELTLDGLKPNTSLLDLSGVSGTIDFDGAYGLYYREIFFHAPFLIANRLNAAQNFAEAQRWYHYIFNPTMGGAGAQANGRTNGGAPAIGPDPDRFWRFLPLRAPAKSAAGEELHSVREALPPLRDLLTNRSALEAYRRDPFDPHAIAGLRFGAYQKAIVMKYIDNLIDWGDTLFTRDTRETIGEAAMLYVLAATLLGPRPKAKPVRRFEPVGTYADFARAHTVASEFLSEVERVTNGSPGIGRATPHRHIIVGFEVPENETFIAYWDRVEDRLFKIRNSLTIEGIFRRLALFDAPIDPAALVASVAGGIGVSGAVAALAAAVPHYRYSYVLGMARELADQVAELGGALLEAINSRDEARLTALERSHEHTILEMSRALLHAEHDEAAESLQALKYARASVDTKVTRYKKLIDKGWIAEEEAAMALQILGRSIKAATTMFKALEAVLGSLPTIEAGASGIGGSPVATVAVDARSYANGVKVGAEIVELIAEGMEITGDALEKRAEYVRREEEWNFEHLTAQHDRDGLDSQIKAAEYALQKAGHAITIHERTIRQQQEVTDFLRNKFANEELYGWMVVRLSALHFQAYKLALDTARTAERALQFELPTSQTFISAGHWDGTRRGLLAAESLKVELSRMDKAHLDMDSRGQEIEKLISMKRSLPAPLTVLLLTGACEFDLSERLFDLDFPGHYFRRIKTVGVMVEAKLRQGQSADPYEEVKLSLAQVGSKTLLTPDAAAVEYMLTGKGQAPDQSVLRVNWRANQQIATARPVDESGRTVIDLGIFEFSNFFDERYLPFEGTGAVSSWRLELSPLTNQSFLKIYEVTNIVINLRYTAKVDRGGFRSKVEKLLRELTQG